MSYPTITLDEVISAAFLRLDNEDTRDELVFQDWVWDALREIGPSKTDIKSECVSVYDLCIQKPSGFLYMLDMDLLDNMNNIHYYQMTEHSPMSNDINGITVAETKEFFELSSNASTITKAEMSFYCYPVNADGEMLVEEKMKEAILAFVDYMFVKRGRRRDKDEFPLAEIQYTEDVWRRKRQEVRGDIKMPDPNQFKAIAERWVTAIPNFRHKKMKSRSTSYGRQY